MSLSEIKNCFDSGIPLTWEQQAHLIKTLDKAVEKLAAIHAIEHRVPWAESVEYVLNQLEEA